MNIYTPLFGGKTISKNEQEFRPTIRKNICNFWNQLFPILSNSFPEKRLICFLEPRARVYSTETRK